MPHHHPNPTIMNNVLRSLAIMLFLALLASQALAQTKVTLSGHMRDGASGEELIGSTVFVKELGTGAVTNLYGFYSLSLTPGTYTVVFSYIGYEPITETIDLTQSATRNIELNTKEQVLKELVITGEREDQNVTTVEMSVEKMDIQMVEKIPQLLGEADVIRSIQLLPGVTTVGEGATGFNVRGGNIDQNLILLDEAPVYNSSHVFGLFSVFNSDAIKDLKLYKGGIPAEYGGRLSSVLDVRQREGNMKKFTGRGGISLISSRLTLEGPLKKNKSSFMIAGRRSYGDLFLKFSENLKDNVAYFYDVNAKVNYIIDEKNRVFLSGYFGRDVWRFGEEFASEWGNMTATARWNHLFSDKLFSNFTGIISDFQYQLGVPEGSQAFEWESRIVDYNLKADFSFFPNPQNTIDFGAQVLFHRFHPGFARGIGDNSIFNEIRLEHQRAWEPAIYISNEQRVGSKLTLQYGLRYSMFMNVGKTMVNQYENGEPTDETSLIGIREYGPGEVIKQYAGLEPRFSANYLINENSSVKASYNRMRQYIHLVSNTTSALPIDVWTPSGPYIEPATVDQWAVGYFRNFKDNLFEASAEVYYKNMQDLLDYKDGAQLLLNETLETEFLSGRGRAYGLETQVKKQKGRMTGWISYTLSRTERQVDGINNNEYYPANYDKTHDISLVTTYDITEKWEFAANFAYQTGRPITYPDGRYIYDGLVVPNYNNRNGARTQDYHRLDLSVTLNPLKNQNRKWQSSWIFAIYNVYRRRNPYSIYFRQDPENPANTEAMRLAVFGEMIPAVTYNFKF